MFETKKIEFPTNTSWARVNVISQQSFLPKTGKWKKVVFLTPTRTSISFVEMASIAY